MASTFLNGAVCLSFFVASVFFFKFWKTSKDSLFAMFGLAFALFGIERIALLLLVTKGESLPLIYLIRLAGFC
jgi:hypothetical protein